ncbi:MAG: sensor domain-containing diguanylate cyclase [bacterium]|nr:sensor domain-containing diguanylate cyclase [bacterium]
MEPSSQQFESDLPTRALIQDGPPPPGLNAIDDEGRFDSNHYLLNAVSDGVLALDSGSRIYYANSTACRLLGFTRSDLSGHPIRDIIADTISPDVTPQQLYDPGLSNGELVSTDTARFRRSDGSLIQVLLTAIPVTDDGANPGAESDAAGNPDSSADAAVLRTLSRFVDSNANGGPAPTDNAEAPTGDTNAPITGLMIVFRDVTPGLYLSMDRINQLLTRLMTQQGARSTIEAALGGVAEIVQADFAVLGVYEAKQETVLFDTYYANESFAMETRGESDARPPTSDDESEPLTPLRVPAADTPYSYIYHNRKAICINEYESHSLARPEFLRHGAVSLLATPVLAESRLMGVVYFFRARRDRPFSDADLENVRALGPVLSAAYFKADNETRLTELATTDPLTNLLNRRVIFEKIDAEIDRARRYDSAFSALMLDLDFFKEINDAYGHLAGDRVLTEIARSLRANTRSADAVARTGGEEFLILLPQTGIEGALRTAEKIRDRIAELRIEAPAESAASNQNGRSNAGQSSQSRERISVTASIGCAGYAAGESRDEFYARLDHLLYQSKRAGRNRITS